MAITSTSPTKLIYMTLLVFEKSYQKCRRFRSNRQPGLKYFINMRNVSIIYTTPQMCYNRITEGIIGLRLSPHRSLQQIFWQCYNLVLTQSVKTKEDIIGYESHLWQWCCSINKGRSHAFASYYVLLASIVHLVYTLVSS